MQAGVRTGWGRGRWHSFPAWRRWPRGAIKPSTIVKDGSAIDTSLLARPFRRSIRALFLCSTLRSFICSSLLTTLPVLLARCWLPLGIGASRLLPRLPSLPVLLLTPTRRCRVGEESRRRLCDVYAHLLLPQVGHGCRDFLGRTRGGSEEVG